MKVMLGPIGEWVIRTIAAHEDGPARIRQGMQEDVWADYLGGRVISRLEWRDKTKRTDAYIFTEQSITITEDQLYITEPLTSHIDRVERVRKGATLSDFIGLPGLPAIPLHHGRHDGHETTFRLIKLPQVALIDLLLELEITP